MKKFKFIIIILSLILVVSAISVLRWLNTPIIKNEIKYSVLSGETGRQVANDLSTKDLVKPAWLFYQYLKLVNLGDKIKAGDYILSAGLTPKGVAQALVTPPAKAEKVVLVREGQSNKEIAAALKKDNLIADNSFSQLASLPILDLSDIPNYDFLKDAPKNATLEGFLFPDTYRLYANDKGDVLIKKMLANFDVKLTSQMKADIAKQGKTVYQIITMASVIQKEVSSANDMDIVSGIFWGRIAKKQRLQSCATLAYILGVNKLQYSIEDTMIDSPYNTYRVDGLPAGPIGNPGLQAIKAAIYPQITNYSYFLSDPVTGQTIWASTFEEHKANKAKYLK